MSNYNTWSYEGSELSLKFSAHNNAVVMSSINDIIINSSPSKKDKISGILSNEQYYFRNSESYKIEVEGYALTDNSKPFIYPGYSVPLAERIYLINNYDTADIPKFSFVFTPKKTAYERIGVLFSKSKYKESAQIFSFKIHAVASEKYVKLDENDDISGVKNFLGTVDCADLNIAGTDIMDLIAGGGGGGSSNTWSNYPAIAPIKLDNNILQFNSELSISNDSTSNEIIISTTDPDPSAKSTLTVDYVNCETLYYANLDPPITYPPITFANTFYVSENGVDADGRGGINNPFQTIQYAIVQSESSWSGNGTNIIIMFGHYSGLITIKKPRLQLTGQSPSRFATTVSSFTGTITINCNEGNTSDMFNNQIMITGLLIDGSIIDYSKGKHTVLITGCNIYIDNSAIDVRPDGASPDCRIYLENNNIATKASGSTDPIDNSLLNFSHGGIYLINNMITTQVNQTMITFAGTAGIFLYEKNLLTQDNASTALKPMLVYSSTVGISAISNSAFIHSVSYPLASISINGETNCAIYFANDSSVVTLTIVGNTFLCVGKIGDIINEGTGSLTINRSNNVSSGGLTINCNANIALPIL
jgi:hypothetical protein